MKLIRRDIFGGIEALGLLVIIAFLIEVLVGWDSIVTIIEAHQGSAMVLLSIVLVMITLWYAYSNFRILKLATIPYRPMIKANLELDWIGRQDKVHLQINLWNIGHYPIRFDEYVVLFSRDSISFGTIAKGRPNEWIKPEINHQEDTLIPDMLLPEHELEDRKWREVYAYARVRVVGFADQEGEWFETAVIKKVYGNAPPDEDIIS